MRVAGLLLVVWASLGVPGVASGQDVGQKGITMGYPESIGLLWHVAEKVAVRPEFRFAHSTTDTNLPIADENVSSTSFGVGITALFYLKRYDSLRTYVAPGWAHSHTDPGAGTTANSDTIAGMFGAQYSVGKRFSIFGETGLAFSHSTTKSDIAAPPIISTFSAHGNSIGTRTGAGVILYF
jgi:hypothetical protein